MKLCNKNSKKLNQMTSHKNKVRRSYLEKALLTLIEVHFPLQAKMYKTSTLLINKSFLANKLIGMLL